MTQESGWGQHNMWSCRRIGRRTVAGVTLPGRRAVRTRRDAAAGLQQDPRCRAEPGRGHRVGIAAAGGAGAVVGGADVQSPGAGPGQAGDLAVLRLRCVPGRGRHGARRAAQPGCPARSAVGVDTGRRSIAGRGVMTAHLVPLLMAAGLTACGVYMLLERNLTRTLLGLMMVGNAINLLIIDVAGPDGNPPIYGESSGKETDADPLAQAMVLTAIVITMGVGAFVLALTYRSYHLTTADDVDDDFEATRLSQLSDEEVVAAERDHGAPVPAGELDAVLSEEPL